jgi:hypothetical protein
LERRAVVVADGPRAIEDAAAGGDTARNRCGRGCDYDMFRPVSGRRFEFSFGWSF